ncbi:MAG: hypothetical protein V2I67_00840, partial [Thermoanaerobaculales bacterium]|nr:hypothetical protein [Thermoanaerobaculales bacterium]
QLEVDDETKPIIAVMTFTDAPSLPTASGSLVQNDLQLWVIKPGTIMTQKTFVGNIFEVNSWYSKKYGMLLPSNVDEEHNNVKVIRIDSNQLNGPFTLQVSSFGINAIGVPGLDNGDENQDFALYVFNAVAAN